jgi:hypothetical protein
MRGVPAYQVKELENGWFEYFSYSQPYDYAAPESRERVIAMTNYLNERRRDWKEEAAAEANS